MQQHNLIFFQTKQRIGLRVDVSDRLAAALRPAVRLVGVARYPPSIRAYDMPRRTLATWTRSFDYAGSAVRRDTADFKARATLDLKANTRGHLAIS
jgi:hypothetical protein